MNAFDQLSETLKTAENQAGATDMARDRERILDIITGFKKSYSNFFKGVPFLDDITQLYWHRLELIRARYKKKGVTLDVHVSPRGSKRKRAASIVWKNDGKYVSAMVEEPVETKSTYYIRGKPAKTVKGKETACYTIVESLKHDIKYVCPYCGAEQSMEQLIDGCDFCETKFELNDFSSKISSFSLRRTYRDTAGSAAKGVGAVVGLFAVIMAVFAFNTGYGLAASLGGPVMRIAVSLLCALLGGVVGALMFFMLLITLVFPLLYYFLIIVAFRGLQKGRNRAAFENDIRGHDPLFSLARFTGNVENKLLSIHFADKYEDVSSIAICDLSKRISYDYTNVLDCVVNKFVFQSYRLSDKYQYVDMQVAMDLLLLDGDDLNRKKELVTMTLMKSKFQMTQEICDAVIYKCEGCGSSVNMLNGGKCDYCQTTLNMAEYDWVVSSYNSTLR